MQLQIDSSLIGSVELFCLAAELGSFTAAATSAGVTLTVVSRAVARLEERFGVRLYTGTANQIRLTKPGRRYFEQCRQALGQLVSAEREITGQEAAPTGLLRLGMPMSYAHYRVLPVLAEFHERFPLVRVESHISNLYFDFGGEEFDVAIRGRAPADPTIIARTLEDAELVVVASPEYLGRRGIPEAPSDLSEHECIQFKLAGAGRSWVWELRDGSGWVNVVTRGDLVISGDLTAGVQLALNGVGLFQIYRFVVEHHLKTGSLVEVLTSHGGSTRPFILLYQKNRSLVSPVREFVEFLTAKISR
ncbi:HTH-type transcriptional regulator PgrR [Paraburkholderia aspalathi]|uniref:LysR family transcriptional regulator n=1 Tax=Paraburkholderia aspalathi TaxID=1324617 RepID=UPI001AFEF1E9|nr:LysR family transcriptional regulator [Paraburkholderia aspalathi]CAE6816818.1 HTH-type transcriptional regulator PgrR [Paraburkholderia aspalathi]